MKKRYLFFLFLTLILLTKFTCYPSEDQTCHRHLIFINNSGKALYVSGSFQYPDTTIQDPNPLYNPADNEIPSNNGRHPALWSNACYENGSFQQPGMKLVVFIFSKDTLNKNTWDQVKSKYLIEKRYEFTLNDLRTMNWSLSYP